MKRYAYIPFEGSIDTLMGPELAVLSDVYEGWYVDYKESLPDLKSIAKHLSAFANQYGGWLFLGVKEKPGKAMTAGSFPGIPRNTVPEAQVFLRQAASAHVNPAPYFETRVVYGPVKDLGLLSDRAIVVVGIPEGTNPPYVHSSGRIYRRVADESDPRAETDRYVLDLLWQRAKNARQRLEKYLTERPLLSKGETAGMVHAYLYFLADPHFAGRHYPLGFGDFADVMKATTAESGFAVPLPNCYTAQDGFIARQVNYDAPLSEGLTFRWWPNGNARISIPINTHDFMQSKSSLVGLQATFLDAAHRHGYVAGRVAEFSAFIATATAVTAKYLKLRKILGTKETFFGKIRCYGTWRIIPFVNIKSYVNKVFDRGFPVVQDEVLTCPPGLTSDTLVALDENQYDDDQGRAFLTILPLATEALNAVGVNFGEYLAEDKDAFIHELGSGMADSVKTRPVR